MVFINFAWRFKDNILKMKNKIIILVLLIFSIGCLAQTELIFTYDEAGNQIYRGPKEVKKEDGLHLIFGKSTENNSQLSDESVSFESLFLKEVRIYPNPVKDVLTVEWTENVSDKIREVRVYQHNTLHWLYTSDKTAIQHRGFQLNMQEQPYGIYILSFLLSDGKTVSVNISKLQ